MPNIATRAAVGKRANRAKRGKTLVSQIQEEFGFVPDCLKKTACVFSLIR